MHFDIKLITNVVTTFLIVFSTIGCGGPRTYVVQPSIIKTNKVKMQRGDAVLQSALNDLVKDADSILKTPIHSVMEKTATPPSGDKHDYLSQGTYWWPDPEKPDGRPYVLLDGKKNPEVNTIRDFDFMTGLNRAIRILGVAYYYTGEEKYVIDAVNRLNVWFVDSATRMNPNLNHSQAVPGVTDGRREGTIDARSFVDLIDGIQLLSESNNFPQQDLLSIKQWFSEYLDWMRTSKIGIGASQLTNNIGTAYYMQLIAYALFTDNKTVAVAALRENIPQLLDMQFELDGRQPKELARTNGWSYSVANLNYWFRIASLAEHLGHDLWNHSTRSGKSLHEGYKWMKRFADGEEWPYQQITKLDFNDSFSSLRVRGERQYNLRSSRVREIGRRNKNAEPGKEEQSFTMRSVNIAPIVVLTESF